jgi:nitrogen fixation protein NifB
VIYIERGGFMAKVAVATTDGTTINEHFGKASEFSVYEVNADGSYTQVRKIVVKEKRGEDSHESLEATVKLLEGVETVLAAQIGPKAVKALQIRGIIGFGIGGSVDSALKSYAKRGKFVKNIVSNPVSGCSGSSGCGCSAGDIYFLNLQEGLLSPCRITGRPLPDIPHPYK